MECSILIKADQIEVVEELAALNYTPKELAMYLNVDLESFMKEWNNKESTLRYHYDKGILQAKAEIELACLEAAKGGYITQAQRFDKILEANKFEKEKQSLIYGED